MQKNLPESVVVPGHCDYNILHALATDILQKAGGPHHLKNNIAVLLRETIDAVIQTPRTGRRSYDELEETEKTYIGTRVEIMLRDLLKVPKGKLDLHILGMDVDVKHTMGSNWMIPKEAIGHPCILMAADEERALCYMGIIVARAEYLTQGMNQDKKASISAEGKRHILWLVKEHPYPPNFWSTIPEDTAQAIFQGRSGNERVAALFEGLQNQPIARDVIEATARQKDFMRRVRLDRSASKGGTRGLLARKHIVLLSGAYDTQLIQAYRLTHCDRSEFISYQLQTEDELLLARQLGYPI